MSLPGPATLSGMSRESLLLGLGTALIGATGLVRREWWLTETPKGRFLVESMGPMKARLLHAGICLVFLVFGVLLASGVLTPLRWK